MIDRVGLWLAVAFALAFALTNGFHDAANSIATLVATRGALPGQAVVLAGVFNMLGALLVGTAVADTIAGIVTVSGAEAVIVIGSGALGAVLWNLLTWWRGLPSSSAHALVGGLVGSALVEGGIGAVRWGGLDGWRPVGVFGVLIALAVSPLIGFALGFAVVRLSRLVLRRATRRVRGPILGAQWGMAAGLSFSHGANDAQKSMGVIAALLLAAGEVAGAGGAAVGEGRLRSGDHAGHVAGRMADRPYGRSRDRSPGADRRFRQPDKLDRGHPPGVVPRGSGLHDPRRRLLGRRGRQRAAPLAARPLDRRPVDRLRLAADAPGVRAPRCRYVPGLERDRMKRRRWFLPETPDVLGMLREQTAITVEGMEALIAWSTGEPGAADRLRECEHRADDHKRELRAALSVAFTTPLEPEDIFELSTQLDRMLNGAKNTVREAEVMGTGPDAAIAEMAAELAEGMRDLARPSSGSPPANEPLRPKPQTALRTARAGSRRSTGSRCQRSSRWTTCARSPRSGSSTAGSHVRATTSAKSRSASGTRCSRKADAARLAWAAASRKPLAEAEDELRVVGHLVRRPRRVPRQLGLDVLDLGHRS